jgi:hypothetical protein
MKKNPNSERYRHQGRIKTKRHRRKKAFTQGNKSSSSSRSSRNSSNSLNGVFRTVLTPKKIKANNFTFF